MVQFINAGIFHCDGGAMFGVVPKRVWQKRYPCNADNFCRMTTRCMLIETDDRLILVDTGMGTKQLDYLKYFDPADIVDWTQELPKHGFAASDVTDVVLTHLHFDHCGGCTSAVGGHVLPTFANARYWVGKAQWENFLHPNVREGNSYFAENMLPVQEAQLLHLVESNFGLSPSVEIRLYNGHTQGQLAVFYHTTNETMVFAGDVIPVMPSMPTAWVSAYDTQPLVAMAEKAALLHEVAEKGYRIIFEHDAYTQSCLVREVNGKFRTFAETSENEA